MVSRAGQRWSSQRRSERGGISAAHPFMIPDSTSRRQYDVNLHTQETSGCGFINMAIMYRAALLALSLVACSNQITPRPVGGYDVVLLKHKVILEAAFFTNELLPGTTLVGDRIVDGRIMFCGVGYRNRQPAEVCVFIEGNDFVIWPGSSREIRVTVPQGGLVREKA